MSTETITVTTEPARAMLDSEQGLLAVVGALVLLGATAILLVMGL